MSQLKIAIIGCGWLGLPLAKKLIKEIFIVKGSTTSKEKISVLKTEKIEPFLIDLNKKLGKKSHTLRLKLGALLGGSGVFSLKEKGGQIFWDKLNQRKPKIFDKARYQNWGNGNK